MTRALRNLRAAREEFGEAVRWYDEQRAGLGAEFFDQVVATTALLEARPEIGAAVPQDSLTRRLLVPRFPYQVVYRVTPGEIVILAVAHIKRQPNYWKNRR